MTKTKSNLNKYIKNFFDSVKLYDDKKEYYDNENNVHHHNYKGLLKAAINVFLEHQSTYTAYEVYETFLMIYQITPEDKSEVDENSPTSLISEPNTLLDLVDIMRKYEENTGELIDWQRDHFIHSVNVFILGIAIYAQNENYREMFKNYIVGNKSNYSKYYRYGNNRFSNEEFLYRWGVASLFHDIGYPFEIVAKQLNKIIDDGVKTISINYDVNAHIDFRDFNEFNSIVRIPPYNYADKFRSAYDRTKVLDLFKPTDIMAHKIALDFDLGDEKFNLLEKHLNSFVKDMTENGFIDHGYFSAILVLNSYGKLIQKYVNKNKDFFFYPIVDSATAILLHNYYSKVLHNKKKPFKLGQLKPEQSPIAYLLIFCDELQEWNRQPYGVMDKLRNHVNDFDVTINDKKLTVNYILKNGSMGLGFERKKEEFLKDVLDVDAVFETFKIDPKVDLDDVQRDILMSEIDAPDVLLRNIEKLAIVINQQYNLKVKKLLEEAIAADDKKAIKKYTIKEKNTRSFKKLEPSLMMSNVRQAKSIPKKLSMIGCEIAHKTDEEKADTTDFNEKIEKITEKYNYSEEDEIIEYNDKSIRILRFSKGDIDDLAIFEHDDWMRERIGTGWKFGHDDTKNKVNSNLVEWDKLDEDTQDFDRDTIKNIPMLLDKIGLKVIRSRLRSLTYKMNQFYEYGRLDERDSGEVEFKGLDKHIQFSNLKQADHLIKILREKGYELVAKNDLGEPVVSFDEDEIEHFAKREHESWYKLKLNLNQTESKNFVDWKELSDEVKEKNRKTFRYLPLICDDAFVGLKIVKNE